VQLSTTCLEPFTLPSVTLAAAPHAQRTRYLGSPVQLFAMFRYRRYRVFLVFAFIAIVALYEFGSSGSSWNAAAPRAVLEKDTQEEGSKLNLKPKPQEVAKETKKFDPEIPAAILNPSKQTPPIVRVTKPGNGKPPSAKTSGPTATPTPVAAGGIENDGTVAPGFKSALVEVGEAKVEATPLPSSVEPIHWSKQSEHFPVASTSMISLPTGKSKPIPKIQFAFKEESPTEKADREAKLGTIKAVFKRSWDGYKEFAWGHDELKPVSGTFKDPFASWGATLVDTLDTLWIMGMKEEFEEAVKAVEKIDFTTTPRASIPLFETTIRYLGGFIAAYDLSGSKHKILLDKAVELAEVLLAAFDTPNRMPITYYFWRPDFANNPHRASNRVVLAELGSLAVEFTRLAQVTGDNKYYDAVARITEELEDFQKRTRLPGMWPTYIDASGCKTPDWTSQVEKPVQAPLEPLKDLPVLEELEPTATTTELLSPNGKKYIPLNLPPPLTLGAGGTNPTFVPGQSEQFMEEPAINWGLPKKVDKRQLDVPEAVIADITAVSAVATSTTSATSASPTATRPDCEPQRLMSPSDGGDEEYTLGGMSDSTYEYLPKQWLLLGGHVDSYRTMYEKSIEVVKDNLLFRPMLPNNDDILFSGKLSVGPVAGTRAPVLEAEEAHLTCFAGGMFGMGAKIFDRPEDLELAKKLTEGCVYAYSMTSTGIMPEAFIALPCESMKSCEWNETMYYEALDPRYEYRFQVYNDQMVTYHAEMAAASSSYSEALAQMTPVPTPTASQEVIATPTVVADTLDKRQLADLEEDHPGPAPTHSNGSIIRSEDDGESPSKVLPDSAAVPSQVLPVFRPAWSPSTPRSHEEFVNNTIQENRLPPGVVNIKASNYILR
jgi:mannosyl-oligosaccharide alpha-1,2-mannosidase